MLGNDSGKQVECQKKSMLSDANTNQYQCSAILMLSHANDK